MKSNTITKLTLNTETLRRLDRSELDRVVGGAAKVTGYCTGDTTASCMRSCLANCDYE